METLLEQRQTLINKANDELNVAVWAKLVYELEKVEAKLKKLGVELPDWD